MVFCQISFSIFDNGTIILVGVVIEVTLDEDNGCSLIA